MSINKVNTEFATTVLTRKQLSAFLRIAAQYFKIEMKFNKKKKPVKNPVFSGWVLSENLGFGWVWVSLF
jgi:hypothetical protein